jgi:hypothetical protein
MDDDAHRFERTEKRRYPEQKDKSKRDNRMKVPEAVVAVV